jgi:hypothetical protein
MNVEQTIKDAIGAVFGPLQESTAKLGRQFAELKGRVEAQVRQAKVEAFCEKIHVDPRGVDPHSVLVNVAAERIAKERNITFGEALPLAFEEVGPPERSGVGVDPYSLALDLRSQRIQKERGLEYGEALELAGQEFTESGLTTAEVAEMFGPDTKDTSTEGAKKQIQKIMLIHGVSEPTATHLYRIGTRVG